ncbi:MAG: hypothetical protein DMG57_06755 [Acidobacteria bacterium]|nr:MAG: hypothetical protein DMG57_06755 [Acidobacteriota bacterium]
MTRTKEEVAKYIEDFLNDGGGPHDWDDFISIRIRKNPELEAIRLKCGRLPDLYPPVERGQYCSDEGMEVLRQVLQSLRAQP